MIVKKKTKPTPTPTQSFKAIIHNVVDREGESRDTVSPRARGAIQRSFRLLHRRHKHAVIRWLHDNHPRLAGTLKARAA